MNGYAMLLKRLPCGAAIFPKFQDPGIFAPFLDIIERDGTELIISECAAAGPANTSGSMYSPDMISRLYREVSPAQAVVF